MTDTTRKQRSRRFTALICGLMAEILIGGVLVVLVTSRTAADGVLFGRAGAMAVLSATAVLLAAGILVVAAGARLPRWLALATTVLLGIASAGMAAVGLTALFGQPGGPGLLLVLGWIFTVVVLAAISRAHAS